jgi:hypothetical protein
VRLRVDDEIYRVDGVWLGPPRRTLPWRARYIAYAVGLGVFIVLQVLERRLGIAISFWSLAYSLLATIAVTTAVLRAVDHDRTITSLVSAFGHEVGAPRLDTREQSTTWRVDKVRIRPGRLPRRVRHERHDDARSSSTRSSSARTSSTGTAPRPTVRHARRRGLHRAVLR